LEKVDAHVITPEEYAEIPELTKEWFERAEVHVGGAKVGRPRSPTSKQAIKLRLDPDVLAAFRATGEGWQTRINAVLRRAAHGLGVGASKPAMVGASKQESMRVKRRKVRRAARRKPTAHKRRA